MRKHTYRTIWLSDLHLGSRNTNSDYLLTFLEQHEAEYLYLVGDILDLWLVKGGWHWPAANDRIVDCLFAKSRNGTKVFYIPGNHDGALRRHAPGEIRGVRLVPEAIHQTADGRRFLVLHGDEFDHISTYSAWLARLGSTAYEFLLRLNRYLAACRRRLGLGYWSLSAFLKHQVKEAVNFVGNFKREIVSEARRRQVDGLICGHVHHASYEELGGVIYTNTGDWVESCTALVENFDGKLQIIHWAEEHALIFDERSHLAARETYAHCYRHRRLAPSS
ncbi:MAG: UDP-2,3-diacylglucosamine diphosphatase [Thermodesulfobacteriota bacterium]